MYSFISDYSEGAHPDILSRLVATNLEQQAGYGHDEYSVEAKELIRKKMDKPDAAIYFLSGGTQTNLITIASLLRVHEAVISARTGHISANETGAIEATGHKVITVESNDGKLRPEHIQQVLQDYSRQPHVVKPAMAYISNSTEIGTIYCKAELEALYACCKSLGLLLFLDGARLGHALTAADNDLSLKDIANLTDLFYVGATKNGGLLGEAIVFNRPELAKDFEYVLKQRGAMLAKGRLLGIQFLELFRDDLYFTLARRANTLAMKIADAIKAKGFAFLTDSSTNQIFPILPGTVIAALREHYLFHIWRQIDDGHAAIRLITSWATEEKEVDTFIERLNAL